MNDKLYVIEVKIVVFRVTILILNNIFSLCVLYHSKKGSKFWMNGWWLTKNKKSNVKNAKFLKYS